MNKLILIGNGFDISHGLRVKYSDFINHILQDRLSNPDQDQKILSIGTFPYNRITDLGSVVDISLSPKANLKRIKASQENAGYPSGGMAFTMKFKNKFFRTAVESKDSNWGGFEQSYFDRIKQAEKNQSDDKKLQSIIEVINREFEEIKFEFIDYLSSQVLPSIESGEYYAFNEYEDWFQIPEIDLKPGEDFRTAIANRVIPDEYVEDVLFLSFNYTKLLEELYPQTSAYSIINIHGELNSFENPVIFGYGDEMDASYMRLEDLDNSALEHIKSFQYSKTSNLHELESFINSNEFQVDIIGHSCGKSDRVLLNYIFTNPNCNRIRIHFRDNYDDYKEIYMNISRHFPSELKTSMRSKVLKFNEDFKMPQLED